MLPETKVKGREDAPQRWWNTRTEEPQALYADNKSADKRRKALKTMNELLEALKQSNYFIGQYAQTLTPNDRAVVLKQYQENIKLIKGIEPDLPKERREDLELLLNDSQEEEEKNEKPLKALLMEYGVLNEYQVRANSPELKSFESVAKGLSEKAIRAVLSRCEAHKSGKYNYNAYVVKCLQNERGKGAGNA